MSTRRLVINTDPAAAADAADVLPERRRGRRTRPQDSVHARLWLAVLAGFAIVWLLLAFHDVVSAAVQQGALRRAASAEQAEAAWRLKSADPLLVGNRLRLETALQGTPRKF
jgi:hypothetical protein